MKYKKTKSRLYKIIAFVAILIFVIVVIRLILGAVFYASRNYEIDRPSQTLSVNYPFVSELNFNNDIESNNAIEKFEKSINSAKHTVEIAVFSMNSDKLRKALINANKRGVKVTLIFDKSRKAQHDFFMKNAPYDIVRIDGGNYDLEDSKNNHYMHHKFMIIDRGYDTQELTTGSLNFTDIGESYNQSFYLITNDSNMISVYAKEFDILKSGKFGVSKLRNREYDPWVARLNYSDGFVEVWNSPGFYTRSAKSRIIQLINSASSTIDIMMWYFTDEDIARTIVKKAVDGVKIKIIAEDTNATTTASSIPFLLKEKETRKLSNMDIILDTKSSSLVKRQVPDGFNPYFHQHTMIVDKKIAVFGTNNWSMWGFYHNDEDIIITDNVYIVGEFDKTMDFFYKTLK